MPPYSRQPYVGSSAFAHKAGLHASAIKVDPDLYQHLDPKHVGNDMRMLVSDMAGRASIELKSRELGFDLDSTDEDDAATLRRVLAAVKEKELRGYTFDAADASFELLLRREVDGSLPPFFAVESWRVITDARGEADALSEATVKLRAAGQRHVETGEGNGPVNALDHALRTALSSTYPEIAELELIDYKVRILDAQHGTDAVDPRAHRDLGRHDVVDDHRGRGEHPRGELGRPRRVGHLRPRPGGRRPALTPAPPLSAHRSAAGPMTTVTIDSSAMTTK